MWMRLVTIAALGAFSTIVSRSAYAHPVPFSYIDVRVETAVNDVELSVLIDTPDGAHVCECPSSATLGRIPRLDPGDYRVTCGIDQNLLNPGRYALTPIARSGRSVAKRDATRSACSSATSTDRTGYRDPSSASTERRPSTMKIPRSRSTASRRDDPLRWP